MDLAAAVRGLREALGMSQQAFATELGLSIRAIANYEKDRKPEPKVLASLAKFATAHEQFKFANVFRGELDLDLGLHQISLEEESSEYAKLGRLTAELLYAWLQDLSELLRTADMSDRQNVEEAIDALQRIIDAIAKINPEVTLDPFKALQFKQSKETK
jgi:transcriptional regulator with XRE-family HTH domain